MNISSKIALGTAQFGLDYGIANESGKVSDQEVIEILDYAKSSGIQTLDTAIAYGESEHVLGKAGVDGFDVITKLPPFPKTESSVCQWCDEQLNGSTRLLKTKNLYAVLLHSPGQLLEPEGKELMDFLLGLKNMGSVKKIGISVYDPCELDILMSRFDIDIVQLPFNIIDNRWNKWIQLLHQREVEVHTRSVFLQGLLLMNRKQRPQRFGRWSTLFDSWDSWLLEENLTPLSVCINYALSYPGISKVVVGVDSLKQLIEIGQAVNSKAIRPPSGIQSSDPGLLNPSYW